MQKYFSILLAFIALLPAMMRGEVSLDIQCSRATIYQGESFNLTLSINGADSEIEEPDFASSDPAEIRLLGSHSNSRSSIQIINGKMTRNVFQGRVLSYSIKPLNQGVYQTGPIIIRVAGKTYRNNGTKVLVKGIEQQDNVIITVKASSTSVLVEEPFSITLSIAIKELPEPYWKSNEPLHPGNMPQITADFLEISDKKKGLVSPDLNQILNSLIDQSGNQPAFAINDYQSRGMGFGSLFGDDPFKPRPIRFRLPPAQIEIDGKRYREYTLKLDYTATGEGEHTFGPVTFKGNLLNDVKKQGNQLEGIFTDVYTIGAAATVRIVPPPDEGRPEDFIGSVGKNMTTVAQLDTTVCKVGDPLTLTLEITGDISISNLRTPALSLQPDLTRDFRIYDENAKTETLKNGKRFTYRVRPTRAGTLEFPPIQISYYDTDLRAYKTLSTDPIPVQAEATTQVAASDSASSGAGSVIEIRKAIPQPSGITLTPDGTEPGSLLPDIRLLISMLSAMPLLVLFGALLKPVIGALRTLKTHSIRSGALSTALRHINRAEDAADLSRAVRLYLTKRLNLPGQSLTGREMEELLLADSASPAASHEFGAMIAQLDEAMYKPGSANQMLCLKEQCRNVTRSVEAALQNSKSRKEEEQL